jgi:hypothetical protein
MTCSDHTHNVRKPRGRGCAGNLPPGCIGREADRTAALRCRRSKHDAACNESRRDVAEGDAIYSIACGPQWDEGLFSHLLALLARVLPLAVADARNGYSFA